jgi:ApbE superfamily uncharacterized protein (UPF0280 family)
VPVAAARRGFLKAVAIAPLARAALAQTPPAAPAPAATVTPEAADAAVADALAEAVRREHPGRLDAAAVENVKKEIARSLEGAARLRAAARLRNGDEPVTLFGAAPSLAERSRR